MEMRGVGGGGITIHLATAKVLSSLATKIKSGWFTCFICHLSVKCCLYSSLCRYLSLSPSLCLSLTSPPLTFQHDPLLRPPDKASIVSQMLFNMESLSRCPSYGATHRAKWGYLPPFSSLHPVFCAQ